MDATQLQNVYDDFKRELKICEYEEDRLTAILKLAYASGLRDGIELMHDNKGDFIESEIGQSYHDLKNYIGTKMSIDEMIAFNNATYYTFPQIAYLED